VPATNRSDPWRDTRLITAIGEASSASAATTCPERWSRSGPTSRGFTVRSRGGYWRVRLVDAGTLIEPRPRFDSGRAYAGVQPGGRTGSTSRTGRVRSPCSAQRLKRWRSVELSPPVAVREPADLARLQPVHADPRAGDVPATAPLHGDRHGFAVEGDSASTTIHRGSAAWSWPQGQRSAIGPQYTAAAGRFDPTYRTMIRFPWIPPMSAQFVGPEVTDAAQIEQDPIVRYDVDDEVDVQHYPDGRYWRFDKPDVAARLFVVKDGKVVQISDVYETVEHHFYWATRAK